MLIDTLRPRAIFPYYSDLEFFDKVSGDQRSAEISRAVFFSGHFGRLGPLLGPGFSRICVLREPLARAVSAYNHMVLDVDDPHHGTIKALSFADAIQARAFDHELWDHQSRLVIANAGEDYDHLTDRQRVECCLEYLRKLECLGIIERPDLILGCLTKHLRVQLPHTISPFNVEITASGVAKSVVSTCIAEVVFRNRIDIAVYSQVVDWLNPVVRRT